MCCYIGLVALLYNCPVRVSLLEEKRNGAGVAESPSAPLEPYEEEVVVRMYDRGLIGHAYKPVEHVRTKVDWQDIATPHSVKKSFDKVMQRLKSKRLVDDHGKSGAVYSLTALGVAYAHRRSGPKAP